MSLSAALTAYAEYVADVLVNRCGLMVLEGGEWVPLPDPARVVRYHGHAIPDDVECSSDGILSVWWEPFITATENRANVPCPGLPRVVLAARWIRCWTVPDVDEEGITLLDDVWDADAATYADAAECVARALMAISCDDAKAPTGDPFLDALIANGRRFQFQNAAPVGPIGGIAGVVWRLQFDLFDRGTSTS